MPVKPVPYWEHIKTGFECLEEHSVESKLFISRRFSGRYCFTVQRISATNYKLEAGYFIGVDWLIKNHSAIAVFPKVDSRIPATIAEADKQENNSSADEAITEPALVSVDLFKMLQLCFSDYEIQEQTDDLFNIDWHAPEITIDEDADFLTPLLVVKFLNILKKIVQKGLRKSYYTVEANLNSRIKGKILVSSNVKQNLVKNRLTNTVCRFEEFGINSVENRLLKKALSFCRSYIDHHSKLFEGAFNYTQLINYCSAAFIQVSNEVSVQEIQYTRFNPFFKEYKPAIEIARSLLKKFSYSISKTSAKEITTPPYWIDMSKLFELYVYSLIKKVFHKNELTYHFTTYGNELDFLINSKKLKMVVDAKYKTTYTKSQVHQDMRQVAGYARLKKVYKELQIEDDVLFDCLIIYPDVENGKEVLSTDDLTTTAINSYKKMYKVGVKLPVKKQAGIA